MELSLAVGLTLSLHDTLFVPEIFCLSSPTLHPALCRELACLDSISGPLTPWLLIHLVKGQQEQETGGRVMGKEG